MHILDITDIYKKINDKLSIQAFNLTLSQHEIVGLFGPNGSGKSSLFNIITGIEPTDSGSVTLSTKSHRDDLTNQALYRRAQLGIGYLPQDTTLFSDLSTYHNLLAVREIAFPSALKSAHKNAITQAMELFQISDVSERLCRFLSGGERRRVELARLLLLEPKFLLLDEPFAGIDPISIRQIKKILLKCREHVGILLTDHQVMSTLDICDRGLILYKGETIAEGLPQQLTSHPRVQRLYLGEAV